MKCEICKKEVDYLEKHHIVPKCRGGSDDKSNLVEICLVCHGLAHDVSFKNNRGGLIKEQINKNTKLNLEARKWLEKNEDLVHKKMMDLYYEDEDKHTLMLLLIDKNNMRAEHLAEWILEGKTKFKSSFTF